MLGFNETITIWNTYKNVTTGKYEYYRHVINGCLWGNQQAVQTSGTTLVSANNYRCGIEEFFNAKPEASLYKPFSEWQKLVQDDMRKYWTVNKGDLVARGVWDIEITGTGSYTIAGVKTMTQPYSFAINVIEERLQGYKRGKHITLTGV